MTYLPFCLLWRDRWDCFSVRGINQNRKQKVGGQKVKTTYKSWLWKLTLGSTPESSLLRRASKVNSHEHQPRFNYQWGQTYWIKLLNQITYIQTHNWQRIRPAKIYVTTLNDLQLSYSTFSSGWSWRWLWDAGILVRSRERLEHLEQAIGSAADREHVTVQR